MLVLKPRQANYDDSKVVRNDWITFCYTENENLKVLIVTEFQPISQTTNVSSHLPENSREQNATSTKVSKYLSKRINASPQREHSRVRGFGDALILKRGAIINYRGIEEWLRIERRDILIAWRWCSSSIQANGRDRTI